MNNILKKAGIKTIRKTVKKVWYGKPYKSKVVFLEYKKKRIKRPFVQHVVQIVKEEFDIDLTKIEGYHE